MLIPPPMSSIASPRSPQIELLVGLYHHMLGAADPMKVLPRHLPAPPKGRTVVVGMGKAAAAMARAVEAHWPGPLSGVIAVPDGAALALTQIEQLEASHPVPDERSVQAGRRLMDAVSGLGPDDLVLALVSGGGSALCALPAQGLSLGEKQEITRALLLRGATIHEINTVRKHLSGLKGGRLAARAHPARLVSLLISDIPGDEAALIASAPTLADPTRCADALRVLDHYGVALSASIREALSLGSFESPKPGDPRFAGHASQLIACAQEGLDAAAQGARALGWSVHILSDAMQGESRDLALAHAAIARQVRQRAQPFAAPCLVLSGGEATVTVKGRGRGGRNTEFALALAIALQGQPGIHALSAGTDGLDGNGQAAGAWISPDTLSRGQALGLNASQSLHDNDSFSYFDAIGSTLVTGPTHTNINDFRALLIEPVSP